MTSRLDLLERVRALKEDAASVAPRHALNASSNVAESKYTLPDGTAVRSHRWHKNVLVTILRADCCGCWSRRSRCMMKQPVALSCYSPPALPLPAKLMFDWEALVYIKPLSPHSALSTLMCSECCGTTSFWPVVPRVSLAWLTVCNLSWTLSCRRERLQCTCLHLTTGTRQNGWEVLWWRTCLRSHATPVSL